MMMKKNLTPLSEVDPLVITEQNYQELVHKKVGAWSDCQSQLEWLAKLHYLRDGFKASKLSKDDFAQREERLVLLWLKKHL